MFTNEGWCANCGLVKSHCSEAIQLITVKCWLFHLPQEFIARLITIVYIPPGANTIDASTELYDTINSLQIKYP